MPKKSIITKEGRREILLETYSDDVLKFADGFDDAIIGIDTNFTKKPRVVYSQTKCIKILIKGGMSYEEAIEYFDYNISGAYVGEDTPIWCDDMMFDGL